MPQVFNRSADHNSGDNRFRYNCLGAENLPDWGGANCHIWLDGSRYRWLVSLKIRRRQLVLRVAMPLCNTEHRRDNFVNRVCA